MSNVFIINGLPKEEPASIGLMTFKRTDIENAQYSALLKSEIETEKSTEAMYLSSFREYPTRMYNCHGMTFACRRTGIYSDEMIRIILKEEYREIKDRKDVLSGDVVIYFLGTNILHSAMVMSVNHPIIRVLSKSRAHSEIEHLVDYTPYANSEKKFYRINH